VITALFIVAILFGAVVGWSANEEEEFPLVVAVVAIVSLLIFLECHPGLIP
jgi:uncharacterized membrane protein